MIQMFGSAFLSCSLWWWYLLYHKNVDEDLMDEQERKLNKSLFYGVQNGMMFFILFIILAGIITALAGAIVLTFGAHSYLAVQYAHWCGISAAMINAVMWIPQIITTYTYKHKGALSEYWVLFSVIMDFVYTSYLIWAGMDISIWLNNVPDGIQTGILFAMIVYYERCDRSHGLDDFGRRRKSQIARDRDVEEKETLLKGNGYSMYGEDSSKGFAANGNPSVSSRRAETLSV